MPALDAALLGLLGLLVGSFLNVVIHRLPRMMELRWAAECAQLHAPTDTENDPPTTAEPFNLMVPRSRCPHCGHQIRWFENVPVLSYLVLRGRCAGCSAPISARYPLIELLNAVLFAWCGWRWGLTATAVVWSGFAAAVLALAAIDWDTTLLPDDITLPLVWAGLLAAALNLSGTSLTQALWGPSVDICRSGSCTGASNSPPARKAWAMAISNCLPPWAPGSAGPHSFP